MHEHVVKAGKVEDKQRWRCRACGYQFTRITPRGRPLWPKAARGLSLLSWGVDERLEQDVRRPRQLSAQVDSPVCDNARGQARADGESHGPGARWDVALSQKNTRSSGSGRLMIVLQASLGLG